MVSMVYNVFKNAVLYKQSKKKLAYALNYTNDAKKQGNTRWLKFCLQVLFQSRWGSVYSRDVSILGISWL